jgi:MoaA/NifB/PqqE/SkfB family radical SAM enzyme
MEHLFISHEGDLYPCCTTGMSSYHRIGHIADEDIDDKLRDYRRACTCVRARLRPAAAGERITYLNIETSLACNATCAMCSVHAPDWDGGYDLYPHLDAFIDRHRPGEILVQGGEVLVQKRTLEWLDGLRARHPKIEIALVTHGSWPTSQVEKIERLFDRIKVSFVGFQAQTIKATMGLDLARTRAFVEALLDRGRTTVQVKYLLSPINVHEVSSFLDWAVGAGVDRISIHDSATVSYVRRDTEDRFFDKIFERASEALHRTIVARRDELARRDLEIEFDEASARLLDISGEFGSRHGVRVTFV